MGNLKTSIRGLIRKEKGPRSKINQTIEISKEVFEKIPDLPNVMEKANLALQMLAEGKLNLYSTGEKNLEFEELKIYEKQYSNYIIRYCNRIIYSILISYEC